MTSWECVSVTARLCRLWHKNSDDLPRTPSPCLPFLIAECEVRSLNTSACVVATRAGTVKDSGPCNVRHVAMDFGLMSFKNEPTLNSSLEINSVLEKYFKRFISNLLFCNSVLHGRSQCPRGLRNGSAAAARLLGLRVRIVPGHGCLFIVSVTCCHGLITRPEESYLVWCAWVWSRNLNNGKATRALEP